MPNFVIFLVAMPGSQHLTTTSYKIRVQPWAPSIMWAGDCQVFFCFTLAMGYATCAERIPQLNPHVIQSAGSIHIPTVDVAMAVFMPTAVSGGWSHNTPYPYRTRYMNHTRLRPQAVKTNKRKYKMNLVPITTT